MPCVIHLDSSLITKTHPTAEKTVHRACKVVDHIWPFIFRGGLSHFWVPTTPSKSRQKKI